MTDLAALLQRHRPILRYDAQEPYFADSAAEWTDNPGNQLHAADGRLLAAAPAVLSLGFLGPDRYADGQPARRDDRIGDPTRDYDRQAAALHVQPRYRNQMYGHWAVGSDGRTWLAYWFFYFYNDFNLVGRFVGAGRHEGDWEMIQLRLDPAAQAPDLAVYAQHRAGHSRAWSAVERVGPRPVVYPARGSHASYFTPGPHWTGAWLDHADGRRPAPDLTLNIVDAADPGYAWITWPGMWGDTTPPAQPPPPPLDKLFDSSPRGPGAHAQWGDPAWLLQSIAPAAAIGAAPAPLPAPTITARRDGADLEVVYATAAADPVALVVTINSPQDPGPPVARRAAITARAGTVVLAAELHDDRSYDLNSSIATAAGQSSPSTRTVLPSAR